MPAVYSGTIPVLFSDRKLEAGFRRWVEYHGRKEELGGFFYCDRIPVAGRPGRWKALRKALKSLGYRTAYVIQSVMPVVNTWREPEKAFHPGNWERFMNLGWSARHLHNGWLPVHFHTHPDTNGEPSASDWTYAEAMAKPPYFASMWAVVGTDPFEIRTFEASPIQAKRTRWERQPFLSHSGNDWRSKDLRKALREAGAADS